MTVCITKIFPPLAVAATSIAVFNISPVNFLISAVAGVAIAVFTESFIKKVLQFDDKTFRHDIFKGVASILCVSMGLNAFVAFATRS